MTMPQATVNGQLGELRRRDQVGLAGRDVLIWNACPGCGSERWSSYALYKKRGGKILCVPCIGKRTVNQNNLKWWNEGNHKAECNCARCADQWGSNNPSWKGGKRITPDGYRLILLEPGDPMLSMADASRCVLEHRLVVARQMGRPLKKGETVHHLNGNKSDNRPGNLELWYTNHGHGVRVKDLLADWARLYNYHCPECNCEDQS